MLKITSRKNETARWVARLMRDADERRRTGCFAAEGARLCADAAASGVPVELALCTAQAREKYGGLLAPLFTAARTVYEIAPPVAQLLCDVKSPQGVFCVCRMPQGGPALAQLSPKGFYLAAESLQNPQNLGALLRTAEALGLSGVLLAGACCDVYTPKALRAAMGATWRLPVFYADRLPEALLLLRGRGVRTYAALPDAGARPVTGVDFSGGALVAVGNEGSGLSEEAVRACETAVTIPMRGRAESLNAAAAAAILMWEMLRQGEGKT